MEYNKKMITIDPVTQKMLNDLVAADASNDSAYIRRLIREEWNRRQVANVQPAQPAQMQV